MKKLFCCGILLLILQVNNVHAQIVRRSLNIKKTTSAIKIDGVINEPAWKNAESADKFVSYQPVPFAPENPGTESTVFLLYNERGIYMGGILKEPSKDSIAAELTGRDGFGNNDFIGVVFDTYHDKLNGFEYFLTPLNEQWDAKVSPGNGEDFAWNAVWQSAVHMDAGGWSFEMFIPYSAIRFGNKPVQDWGFNIVRQRRKSGQKTFWQPLDPNANGFLTQEGTLTGLENIKPPLRLQFSPYFATYLNHDGYLAAGNKTEASFNGGMDVKYGINQAFTLDMTLIPDFGQVQTDKLTLNLSPFEQRFSENRAFFTEGTELFNKGNLFYSRRIGGEPFHYGDVYARMDSTDKILDNPEKSKLVNATKISGRTQNGLGIGVLNAVTKPLYATVMNKSGEIRQIQTDPLTNYNVFVLDQTLKNNSSLSLVNTNVWRSGHDRDANVTSAIASINDKSNTWNGRATVSVSQIINYRTKNKNGYAHNLSFGKRGGAFNYSIYQDLVNNKYDKNDLAYLPNNNYAEEGITAGYNWNTPKGWYNRMYAGGNVWYNSLLTPIDFLKRKSLMYQNSGFNLEANAQLKSLWAVGMNINKSMAYNDFYETRDYGRVFKNKGSIGMNAWLESNSAKKLSGSTSVFAGTGGVFKRTSFNYSVAAKYRFSSKFSIDHTINFTNNWNQVGWASTMKDTMAGHTIATDTIIFSRRNLKGVENILNIKYNFNNKMGLSLNARHDWTKVAPRQFYQLDINGDLNAPDKPFTKNVNKNFNFLSIDMVYSWQFNPGSFLTIAWKDIGDDFSNRFQKDYVHNLTHIIQGNQFNSLSFKMVWFIDYLTLRSKVSHNK